MKKTLASILCFTLFLGMLGWTLLPSASGVATEQYAGIGEYTVRLDADPTTNTPPAEFGTTTADGKVWADKSVVVREDHFEVTLSALAQEYISEDQGTASASTAADVVMILDLSGSMQDKNLTIDTVSMTRTKAMVKAVNEATEIMMAANPNNRLLIYTYQSDNTGKKPEINEFLPLGHYSNDTWSTEGSFSGNSGKYFNYVVSGEEGGIQTATNLKKDNATFSKKTQYTQYGTCTQHGILKGIQALIDAIGKETKTIERKPYVLLFTDGAPGNSAKSWYDPSSSSCSFTHQNSGSSEITATTLLSAALMKDRLNTAYQAYNGKAQGIEWFNIGLGVGDLNQSKLFLKPSDIVSGTATEADEIRKHISTYTGGTYADYAHYATNYIYTVDSYLVDTGEGLQQAFNNLADKIEEETKTITFPILSAEGAASDLIFTDTMGDGMTVSGITLHPTKSTAISGVAAGNTYTFAGFDLSVTLSVDSQGRQVLQWNIPADEVAIFSFADRKNPANGEYTSADPLQLTYQVSMASEQDYAGQNIYSNHSATARFSIASDNIYYYETDGTLKTAPFAAQAKESNLSQTDANAVSYSTSSIQNGTTVTAALGNNGRLAPAALLEKQAENALIAPDGIVDFELKITNKGETALSNIVIKDTLPAALTYCNGSAQNASVSANGAELTFTVPHIDAGASLSVTYQAALGADAEHGSTHTNLAAITRINEVDVYGPVSEQSTVTAHHTYQVLYSWSGDFPEGATLPIDNAFYTPGAYYEIDTDYTDQTMIEKKDAFGNVSDRWTFSGWTDPNRGVMGNADVTVYGVWSHQTFSIPAYKVTYTWLGNIPDAATLPTDPNTYVTNQPYPIDSAYQAGTIIPDTDPYGNVIGKYTFSGWTDPNSGVMGNGNITIQGVWSYESVTVPSHRVLYEWGDTFPKGENPPIDPYAYVKNQSYEVDTTYTDQTTVQSFDAFGNVNGIYSFGGWEDPNNGVMGDADITVHGVWTFESVDVPAHKVLYEWSGTFPPSETLPTDPNSYVKNQPYGVDTTYTSATVLPTFDAYGNLNGRYMFSGWDNPNNGVMGDKDITIRGVWTFESVDVPTHNVFYEWSGEIPAGEALPTDGNSYVKNQNYTVDTAYTAATEIPTFDAFGNVNGIYSFSGWTDPNNGVMGDEDITIRGEWKKEILPPPVYQITYLWTGDVPLSELLPNDSGDYMENQSYNVDATYTDQSVIEVKNELGEIIGRYTFSGWEDPNNAVMGAEDVVIRGVWVYEDLLNSPIPDPETPPEGITPDPEQEQNPNEGQIPDEEHPTEDESKPQELPNPSTGDVPIELFFLIWISSAAALILLTALRRKMK